MALSPEKNDVDIRALFEYRKPVTLHGVGGKREVYMRVIGDAELQRARVKALRASRELREALKDKTSDEYLAYIPDLSSTKKEKILELYVMSRLRNISKEVAEDLRMPFPEEPDSDASLEEQEEYQKLVDDYPKKREARIKEEIIKRAEQERDKHKGKKVEDLVELYHEALINELCEIEMNRVFYDYTTYFSLYEDEKYRKHLFDSFEEFDNLPSEIKDYLLEEYRNLELGLDDLKK